MIIVKTANGDRFINEAETLQVNHNRDNAQVEVWPSKWGNNQQVPQCFVIEHVEAVMYTNNAQPTHWQDGGSEIERLSKLLNERTEQLNIIRQEFLKIEQDRDDLKERLAKFEPSPKDYDTDLFALSQEIDRIEINEREKQRIAHPGRGIYQKGGNATRFLNISKANGIKTVGQLIAVGRIRFENFKNMGHKCAEQVSQALENLYGIKW